MSEIEIVRKIEVEDKTVHIHIHLMEDEVRRLLIPHVVQAFATELQTRTAQFYGVSGSGTIQMDGKGLTGA